MLSRTTQATRKLTRAFNPAQHQQGNHFLRAKSTYQNQENMPRLPVAPLEAIRSAYLRSVEPMLTVEEFATTSANVEQFFSPEGKGRQLHNDLVRFSSESGRPNWLEQWWDVGAYLSYQSPLPYRSNYYFILENSVSSAVSAASVQNQDPQTARASRLIRGILDFHLQLKNESIVPDTVRGKNALCMSQFARLFSHVRVPGKLQDTLLNYTPPPPSLPTRHFATEYKKPHNTLTNSNHHVIVLCNGYFFVLDVLDANGLPFSAEQIATALDNIKQQAHKTAQNTTQKTAQKTAQNSARGVGALSALPRGEWADIYELDFLPLNDENVDVINSALFSVSLDNVDSKKISEHLLHGADPTNRFYDKHQLIVFEDGEAGFNMEHAPGDGTTALRLAEHCFAFENNLSQSNNNNTTTQTLPNHHLLSLRANDRIFQGIQNAISARESSRMRVKALSTPFGSRDAKLGMVAPDAVAQMTIQLAFYKQFGYNVSTYESGSTRGFLHGRTETIRTLTAHSASFVSSMGRAVFASARQREMQTSLLRRACATHRVVSQNAAAGLGCDRAMLGMRMLLRERNEQFPAIFTDPAFSASSSWRLSTSHCGSPAIRGFGFGNVADDGYGIGYFVKDAETVWNVTSDSSDVDVGDFCARLQEGATDIAQLLKP